MRNWSIRVILAALMLATLMPVAMGCATAEGVKQDTKTALDATGKGLEKGAAGIAGPTANEPAKDVDGNGKLPE